MILTITLILSFLVALNFLLLIFSCNKTSKKLDNRLPPEVKTEVLTKDKSPKLVSNQLKSRQLAPTGS
ncbi:hypothetical protein DFQ10_102473 [Winogradskyella eximia]|jgi:hypothetical protein|uniref:Uncharacterized protein n=1 Tax=Winogradskyella eximia TaxID=262006 RepID=A0A3D9H7X9_9FLAO|nr:hypothetical protein DFQ10_102473 [Winogradskyella eximia]